MQGKRATASRTKERKGKHGYSCTYMMLRWFDGCFTRIPVAPTWSLRASVKLFVPLQFLNLTHSVGLLGRVISPSQGRYLTQTQNKRKQISLPQVGFELRIPAFEQTKTVHAFLKFLKFWFVRLLALRPLLAYCASLG
jgi:hypothetical protein